MTRSRLAFGLQLASRVFGRPLSQMRFLAHHRICLLVVLASTTALGANPPLVVTRALLWSAQGSQNDRELVIEDGRVVAVGASGELARPSNARVVDAAGDTLLPGLIDAHVHLVQGNRLPPDVSRQTVYAANARALLRSGVTAGRIHLMPLDALAELRAAQSDEAPMPRLQLAGPALFGGAVDSDSPTANTWGVADAQDARQKVRRLHAAGAEWVALHDLTGFRAGEAEAIVAEARRLGLGILAAGEQFTEIECALTLGVDSIDYLDRSDAARHPPELLRRLRVTNEVAVVPLLGFPRRWQAYRDGSYTINHPVLTEFLPSHAARYTVIALDEDRSTPPVFGPKYDAAQRAKALELASLGHRLVMGTDCGSPAHFHADSIWQELEAWREVGVTPDAIIRGATVNAARLLRAPDLGHLGVGAHGDFVLYAGRITDGPFRLQRVRAVAKAGRLFVDEGRWIEPPEAAGEVAEITLHGQRVTGRDHVSAPQDAAARTFAGTRVEALASTSSWRRRCILSSNTTRIRSEARWPPGGTR